MEGVRQKEGGERRGGKRHVWRRYRMEVKGGERREAGEMFIHAASAGKEGEKRMNEGE